MEAQIVERAGDPRPNSTFCALSRGAPRHPASLSMPVLMFADARQPAGVADWRSRGGVTERNIFGTHEEAAIDAFVDGFCRAQLGSDVAEVLFRATSVGVVYGAALGDGRRVVVKAFQPQESAQALAAAQQVQGHLHREGFPCPAPLVAPVGLVNGPAMAETFVDDGEGRDTHEPGCRRLMAELLARHLELTRACGQPAALRRGWSLYTAQQLWPREAHTPTVDLHATAAGAEWVDAIAVRAKPQALAAASGDVVVGHHDWSGKHFRFGADQVTVVYDWDSVRLGGEAVIVGNAAMTFTANFDLPGLRRTPTPSEVRAFVDEYSAARSTALTRAQREQVAACATFLAAYTARCEHAHRRTGDAAEDPNSFAFAMRMHGNDYLRP